jgi:hypothetical protein
MVLDSDSDQVQCDTSGTEDEEMEPRPPSRKSPLSQDVSSSDFSASTCEDDEVVENVATLPIVRHFTNRCVGFQLWSILTVYDIYRIFHEVQHSFARLQQR